jgi:hypothetical protein
LSSGYLGLAAGLVAVAFFARGVILRKAAVLVPAGLAAAVALPVVQAYRGLLGERPESRSLLEVTETLQLATAHLTNLAGYTPEMDRADHSLALVLGGVVLALVVVAPRVLGPREGWRTLLATAIAGLLLSFGSRFATSSHVSWFPMPLSLVEGMAAMEWLRFPARFFWVWCLCGSVLAARAATVLADRGIRPVRWLLVAALVDAFVVVGLPMRQVARPAAVPEIYAQAEGAVLDLYPEAVDANGEMDRWLSAIACVYQGEHGKPIPDHCANVPEGSNLRVQLSRWLSARLLSGDAAGAAEGLASLRIREVALHPDLFQVSLRNALEEALSGIATRVGESSGGERVVLYRLPGSAVEAAQSVGDLGGSLHLELLLPGEAATGVSRVLQGGRVLSEAPLGEGSGLPLPHASGEGWFRSIHTADFPLGEDLEVQVLVGGQNHWSGSIRLRERQARRELRSSGAGARRLHRAGPVSDTFAALENPGLGSVAAGGWGIYLLILVGWGTIGRREESAL